jgi:predicted nucleotidyltransferase
MIYTVEQLRSIVTPVAEKYKLKSIWVFGSYARGEATDISDVDLLIDYSGSSLSGIFSWVQICDDLQDTIQKKIDLVSVNSLKETRTQKKTPNLAANIERDKVIIFESD